ncbi:MULTISPECIES: DNA internalization-related competence protein ComEC/Rec2 [Pseudomonas]|uniref:DNA internalization-related competence protein ComEC/Rec2 n=1 Tax=Pseudomonas gingeri TaxID=117681 RepID=A0A7Y8BKW0_9PSED|nr:DNA internalization-related competence protein ComEC/Rec2 [Pseudomonas gingeri]NWB47382.1 DNA internalization-related competence protein ComEC/Rec2 [Pseudomonas gingeri]
MRTGMLALAAGLVLLRLLPQLPPVGLLLVLPVLGLMLLPFRTYPLALFLLGFSWACFQAQRALDDRLAPELDGQTLWVEGRVVGLPQRDERVVRFELEGATSRRARLPARLRLSWFGGPDLRSGERWRLAVQLKRGHGLLNPAGFDYEAWLLARRIGATGTIKDGQLLVPASGAWRDGIRRRLLQVDAQGQSATLVALVLGDGSGLSTQTWRVLQDTGTLHLLVISGQHIGLLAGLVYALIAGLARYGLWPGRWPWLPWACGLAFAVALGYGLLAGFGVPVRRACVMLAMVLLWRLRYRHLGALVPLLAALNLVLWFDPLVSLQVGFWLSFAAVAVLIFTFSGRLGAWRPWQSWTRGQWVIALGLFPALLLLGLPVSLSAPLANWIAVPLIGLLVLPLALLGTLLLPLPWVGEGLLWLAGGLLAGLFQGLEWLAAQVPAWIPAAVPPWAWALSGLGILLLLLPAGIPLRPLGWPLAALAVFAPSTQVAPGEAEVWQLDVGQGLAILVRTREHTLLYDAGPRFGEFDQGERVVLPSLRKLGVRQLDTLLLSHADADHAGGALAVRRGLPVSEVLGGDVEGLPAALQAQPCVSGRHWQWDGVRFSLWRWPLARDSNQSSCVLQIEANGERLLLTGDIDIEAERAFLDSPLAVASDWLQSPHHGSRSSSSMVFLQRLAPRGVLISRGRGNSFGHPHPQVIARYKALDMAIFDSAEQGALRLVLGRFDEPQSLHAARRFWRQ